MKSIAYILSNPLAGYPQGEVGNKILICRVGLDSVPPILETPTALLIFSNNV
jgi:hypothetical protein